MGMTVLTAAALQHGGSSLRTTLVDVPAWGGQVRLRELSGRQRMDTIEDCINLLKALQTLADGEMVTGSELRQAIEMAARIIALAWIDSDGNLVVTDEATFDLLLQQSMSTLFELSQTVLNLSAMAPDAVEEAKKNSSSSQMTDSGTP